MGKYSNVHINKSLGRNIYGQDVAERNRIGYCYCQIHPGYLTEAILKEKNCIAHNCRWLKKFEDHNFWVNREERKQGKKENKRLKREVEHNENLILDLLREETEDIQNFCVLAVNKVDDYYMVRCVYLYNNIGYEPRSHLKEAVEYVSEITGFNIQTSFIQNTYQNKKELIRKVKENENK